MAASHIPSILIVDDIGANLRLLYDILVSEVLAGLDDMIKSSHAKITIEELPVLYGCETELKLLFSNLVVNAIKFRRKNILPEIKITAESCEKKWAFKISDNGIGIEKKTGKRFSSFSNGCTIAVNIREQASDCRTAKKSWSCTEVKFGWNPLPGQAVFSFLQLQNHE
jgi:light-regulated signal transduction histidine kinase (bacteriophytochrome)